MPCLPPHLKGFYKQRLDFYLSELAKLDAAYLAASIEVEEYRLNTGEGSQQTKYRDLEKIQKAMRRVEAEIAWVYNKLGGTGIISMKLRRKNSASLF